MRQSKATLLIAILALSQSMFNKEFESWSFIEKLLLLLFSLAIVGILNFAISKYNKWIIYIQRFSEKLAYVFYLLLFHPIARIIYLAIILIAIVIESNLNNAILILSILAFLVFLWSIKQFPLQEYRKIGKKEVIFEDDFSDNKGWMLNYWGSTNPEKTNRIENSSIIFEAKEDELLNPNKEFGAYIDLRNGIEEGNIYEIYCNVKSEPKTTMKFQLWIHDNIIGNKSSLRTAKSPEILATPKNHTEEIKTKFTATATNGMRIHLHNKGGLGKIIVYNVRVIKL